MPLNYGKGLGSAGLNRGKGLGSASVREKVQEIIAASGGSVNAEVAAVLPSIVAAVQVGTSLNAAIASVLPSLSATAQVALAETVSAIISVTMPSLTATAAVQLNDDIRAVIFDGLGDFLAITSIQAGVSASDVFTGVWSGKLNADNSDMTFYNLQGGITLERTSANAVRAIGGASAQGFTNSTTAISSSAAFMAVGMDVSGHSSTLKVATTATTYTGTPVTGSSISYDLGLPWTMGVTLATADVVSFNASTASKWLASNNSLFWATNARAGLAATTSIEEWWDTSAGALRDPGTSGANATGSSPLALFAQFAATHTTNRGTGNDAVGSNSGDGVSPARYQPDYQQAGGDAGTLFATFGSAGAEAGLATLSAGTGDGFASAAAFSYSLFFKTTNVSADVMPFSMNDVGRGLRLELNARRNSLWTPLHYRDNFGDLVDGKWHHFCFSVSGADRAKKNAMVDGVSALAVAISSGASDYRMNGTWKIGGRHGGTEYVNGPVAHFWFDNSWVNWHDPAVRAKVLAADGRPASAAVIGVSGDGVTGSPPLIYLPLYADNIGQNLGDSGDFTFTGTVVTATTLPIASSAGDPV